MAQALVPDTMTAPAHALSPRSDKTLITVIVALVVAYFAAVALGVPWFASLPAADHSEHAQAAEQGHGSDAAHSAQEENHPAPPLFMVLPFAALLGAIAVLPLVPKTAHWWESNLHRFYVAAVLAAVTLAYYLLASGVLETAHVIEHAVLDEYIPFIVLLFSLYTISGGIRIECDLRALPVVNAAFIGVGATLASFIGTTGAAMLLIRPLLETNKERRHVVHTVVFFIFAVCNCGGLLLPIGDPPLFLGYLRGVDFFWTLRLWPEWLFVNGLLLVVYVAWDGLMYRREKPQDIQRDETQVRPLRIYGWKLNGLLLLGVIASVAFLDKSKAVPGTNWHPWPYLREVVQLALVAVSLGLGVKSIREKNNFNYHAILEVAALFIGIFICMQPALQILHVKGPSLGVDTPKEFFWATGSLSSVLDNAPTYVVFFETAKALGPGPAQTGGVQELLLVAISLGAVFMGAMTYIGNGPNFMVKAIAESSGIRMPSFFGYMLYSCGILLPIFWLMTEVFLKSG